MGSGLASQEKIGLKKCHFLFSQTNKWVGKQKEKEETKLPVKCRKKEKRKERVEISRRPDEPFQNFRASKNR